MMIRHKMTKNTTSGQATEKKKTAAIGGKWAQIVENTEARKTTAGIVPTVN